MALQPLASDDDDDDEIQFVKEVHPLRRATAAPLTSSQSPADSPQQQSSHSSSTNNKKRSNDDNPSDDDDDDDDRTSLRVSARRSPTSSLSPSPRQERRVNGFFQSTPTRNPAISDAQQLPNGTTPTRRPNASKTASWVRRTPPLPLPIGSASTSRIHATIPTTKDDDDSDSDSSIECLTPMPIRAPLPPPIVRRSLPMYTKQLPFARGGQPALQYRRSTADCANGGGASTSSFFGASQRRAIKQVSSALPRHPVYSVSPLPNRRAPGMQVARKTGVRACSREVLVNAGPAADELLVRSVKNIKCA